MQQALAQAPHAMQAPLQEQDDEQSLREHLLAQVHSSQTPQHHEHVHQGSSTGQHGRNIDPAIAGNSMLSASPGESGGDDQGDDRKGGKRELSTSKRAAQNRAAQRAFRQRKEGHIKKLEEQVRDYHILHESYKAVQAENYQLRDYIINLQSRLIESQGEFPQPPSNINLSHPQAQHLPAPTAPMSSSTVSPLQASTASQLQASATQAQAVTDLRRNTKRSRSNGPGDLQPTSTPNLPASTVEEHGPSITAS